MLECGIITDVLLSVCVLTEWWDWRCEVHWGPRDTDWVWEPAWSGLWSDRRPGLHTERERERERETETGSDCIITYTSAGPAGPAGPTHYTGTLHCHCPLLIISSQPPPTSLTPVSTIWTYCHTGSEKSFSSSSDFLLFCTLIIKSSQIYSV